MVIVVEGRDLEALATGTLVGPGRVIGFGPWSAVRNLVTGLGCWAEFPNVYTLDTAPTHEQSDNIVMIQICIYEAHALDVYSFWHVPIKDCSWVGQCPSHTEE